MGTSSSKAQVAPKKETPVKTEVKNVKQIDNITETTGQDNEEYKEQDNDIKENYQIITEDKATCLPNDKEDAISVDSKDSGDTYSMFKKCQFYPEVHKETNSKGLVMKYVRTSYTSNDTKGQRPKDSKHTAKNSRNKTKEGSFKMASIEYSSNNIGGEKYQMIFIPKEHSNTPNEARYKVPESPVQRHTSIRNDGTVFKLYVNHEIRAQLTQALEADDGTLM